MTTSSSSSSRRAALAVVAVVLLAPAFSGCSSESSGDCDNENIPTYDQLAESVLRRAVMRFEQTLTYDLAGKTTASAVISLSLVDVTRTKTEQRPPERLVGSETCVFLSGAPRTNQCRDANDTPPCPPDRLAIDSVAVAGVAGGAAKLDKKGEGSYVNESPPTPLFGSDRLSVSVTGQSSTTHFPTYTQDIAAPEDLDITAPKPGTAILGGDVQVKWRGSGANYVEITVRTNKPGDTDTVRCIVVDDGCHTLPAVAFDRLALGMTPGDSFELTIRRVNVAVKAIDTKTSASITSVQRVVALLPQQ